jgi:hypothetical protein
MTRFRIASQSDDLDRLIESVASLLIQQGANAKHIQQQLGHGSISITLDIYSHLFQGDHRHHVHRLDDPQEEPAVLRASEPESATQAQHLDMTPEYGPAERIDSLTQLHIGGVTERPNVPVLKTGDLVRGPRVQISPPPPCFPGTPQPQMFRV